MITIEQRLKDLINQLGISQASFAKSIGIKPSTITDFYSGRSKGLSRDSIIEISKEYNVSIDWLLTGHGSMFLSDSKTSTVVEQPQSVQQLPVCRTTEQCLDSITAENIHQTRWFKEMDDERQYIIAAVNTPGMPEKVHSTVKGMYMGAKISQEDEAAKLYKKGEAG